MSTNNDQSSYVMNVKKWAGELQNACMIGKNDIIANRGEETFAEFTKTLNSLLKEIEDNEQKRKANDQQIQLLAMACYDKWQQLWKQERSELGSNRVPIGGHRLPPLPYRYEDLEPYIDRQTMELHHLKHHQSYVDGLNRAEEEIQKARKSGNYDLLKHWKRELAFHGAGHYLHTIFWNVMNPNGGGQPSGALRRQIEQDFGSFSNMKEQFSEAASQVEGGGWALLVWSPRAHRLEILQAEKHQNLTQQDVVPLLVLDVWEHAYYLRYQNERDQYIDQWWNIVYWPEVEKRFLEAIKLKWEPY